VDDGESVRVSVGVECACVAASAGRAGGAPLVDPTARTLEVFRLSEGTWRLVATWRDDAVVRAEPFDAIELELAALWTR